MIQLNSTPNTISPITTTMTTTTETTTTTPNHKDLPLWSKDFYLYDLRRKISKPILYNIEGDDYIPCRIEHDGTRVYCKSCSELLDYNDGLLRLPKANSNRMKNIIRNKNKNKKHKYDGDYDYEYERRTKEKEKHRKHKENAFLLEKQCKRCRRFISKCKCCKS